jgi:hypothetical protein
MTRTDFLALAGRLCLTAHMSKLSGYAGPSARSNPNPYLWHQYTGTRFVITAQTLLDLEYLIAYADPASSWARTPAAALYNGLHAPDADFNLLLQRLRYPISRASNPETLKSGLRTCLTDLADEIAGDLLSLFDTYTTEILPAHAELFSSAFATVDKDLRPREAELFDAVIETLHLRMPFPVEMFFVGHGTVFGAFTSQPSLSVIDVSRNAGLNLIETILHESVHGVERLNANNQSAYALLRRELSSRGLQRDTEAAWHALIFWNSASIIKQKIDPAYVDYGETFGVYDRAFKTQVVALRVVWNQYLQGDLSLSKAISLYVDKLT